MVKLLSVFLLTVMSSSLVQARCSYKIVDEIKAELKNVYYQSQKVEAKQEVATQVKGIVSVGMEKRVAMDSVPKVSETTDCVFTYKNDIAPLGCKNVFHSAENIKLQLAKYIDQLSDEELLYFRNYSLKEEDGSFLLLGKSDEQKKEEIKLEEIKLEKNKLEEINRNRKVDGYGEALGELSYEKYLQKITEVEEICSSKDSEVGVWKDPNIKMEANIVMVTVEVFNKMNQMQCRFVANMESKRAQIEVPLNLHDCVSNKDNYLITEVSWQDSKSGEVQVEYAAGFPDDFVTDDPSAEAKVITKSDDETKDTISALKDTIDRKDSRINIAGMVKESKKEIIYEDLAGLDQDVLMLGYMCQYGGYDDTSDPGFQDEYNEYIAEVRDGSDNGVQQFQVLGADDSSKNELRDYYKATLKNIKGYKAVAKLYEDYKNGNITYSDLMNWDKASGAHALCYSQLEYSKWEKDVESIILSSDVAASLASISTEEEEEEEEEKEEEAGGKLGGLEEIVYTR